MQKRTFGKSRLGVWALGYGGMGLPLCTGSRHRVRVPSNSS